MTATSQAPSSGSVGGSGGMEELLPLVLQLTNPEQVSYKMSAFSTETFLVTENVPYCIHTTTTCVCIVIKRVLRRLL
jgi:hypothetical protein